ncbi:MAG: ABC transporter permease [Verrucomicrobia bacterium]|nr:ABC transporter permease [Verrucomicrobiota bacterium]
MEKHLLKFGVVDGLLHDARFSLRTLRRNPGFTLAAVLTLALGIGVNTAMFSVINAVLLRPLPYEAGDRLVLIRGTLLSKGIPQTLMSAPDFLDLKQQGRLFERIAAYRLEPFDLTGDGEALRINGAQVTADLLPMLGVPPVLGRVLLPEDGLTGANRVVLVGHALWHRRFGADPNLVGKTIRLSSIFSPGNRYTVVGIMPPRFDFPKWGAVKSEFWVPMTMDTEEKKDRGNRQIGFVLGRLKPGITLPQAQIEMDAIARRLEATIINETMARRLWPGEDPIGKRFKLANTPWPWFTVVGVVEDVRRVGEGIEHFPEVYRPMAQFPNAWMSLVVKTRSDPMKSAALVCDQIRAVDKDVPIQKVRTMEQILSESVARPRFYARLLGAFAALALILTAVGVSGVMAYGVSRRTHEIGIRAALGANRGDVLGLVLRQGMTLALVGVVLGTIGAFALTRFAANLLYGIDATDPVTFATVGLLLVGVALVACFGPAHRATLIDPMTALRYE